MASEVPQYLDPYERAAQRHGAGFGSLLWASEKTQAVRFAAICAMADLHGKSLLDVGCGRADFVDYLEQRKIRIASYSGIEGVPALAEVARAKRRRSYQIIETDFVAQPWRMFVGAQVVLFSGSLNTLNSAELYSTLGRAYEASGEMLIFNFLCSPNLAGAPYLSWRRADDVLRFARTLSQRVRMLDDYLNGDCTVAIGKLTDSSTSIAARTKYG